MLSIDWEGAVNARRVNERLVRMARREWLTPEGWAAALSEGFATVVDLRSPYEWETVRDGDHELPPALRERIRLLPTPTEDPEHPEFKEFLAPYLDHPDGYATYLRLFGQRVASALLAVAEAPGGVIVHCSAGRDRTGLVVALGQKLAGWDDEDIVDGYAAAAVGINELHRTNPHPIETYLEGEEWEAWLGERVTALRAFLAEIDTERLLAEAGLGRADLEAIRRRFARPTASNR